MQSEAVCENSTDGVGRPEAEEETEMTCRIHDEFAAEGTIIPVPLILLAVAISFPFVIVGCLIEKTARWIMAFGRKDTWI